VLGVSERAELTAAPERLWELPSWLLNRAARHATAEVAAAFEAAGASRQQFTVLTALTEGPASQATLGRRLGIDRSDIAAIVGELERGALIERRRDEDDRRRNVVTLTPAGRDALARLDRAVEAAQEQLLAPLAPHEREELARLLIRLLTAGERATR
jgi:DNA-binding MarR family transcriptional regulator